MRRATTIAAFLLSAFIGAAGAPAFAANGAFAHDEASGKFGYSWNEENERKAEAAALKGCASDKCKIVFRTGAKQCGAIAMTQDGKIWGGATRPKRDAAEKAAVENCQKRTSTSAGQCKVRGAECNN